MSTPREGARFFCEEDGVQHDPITDDVYLISLENTRGDGTEDVLLSFELQRMPCVRPPLEACYNIIGRSQYIDDFPFAFVSPL